MPGVARRGRVAWLVEDNASSRAAAAQTLRKLRFRIVEIGTQERFVNELARVHAMTTVPDLVVLDLRLPWADQDILVGHAIAGGIECLALLRQEAATRNTSVVIWSAFIDEEEIRAATRRFGSVALVDKRSQPCALEVVIDNLLPRQSAGVRDRIGRAALQTEKGLHRLAALIATVMVIGSLVGLALSHILR